MTELERLQTLYRNAGAELAPDGIPLHFGDLRDEYAAAQNAAILLDRSHEGRLQLSGTDRLDLINRISTNQVINLGIGQAVPTLFTNANARILDRAVMFVPDDEVALLLAGPGRGAPLEAYLRRNIFYNDAVELRNLGDQTHQFALHGPAAGEIVARFLSQTVELPVFSGLKTVVQNIEVMAVRQKPYIGAYWVIIVPKAMAADAWEMLMAAGAEFGLLPAGGLTYNTLRIRAGRPGAGRELTADYIPLELGLWDEVSFSKGCYTGQEIIARMESRNRLARTMVRLQMDSFMQAPALLFHDGKQSGTLTSSVTAPDGTIYAMAVVKAALAEPGTVFQMGASDGPAATLTDLLGVPPPYLAQTD